MAQSSGFDMSKMSTATKILLGAAVLLLIDSFLSWQKVCAGLGDFGLDDICASASMWGGDGSIFGVLAGLAVIGPIVWEVMQLVGAGMNVGMPASKVSAYLGFAVLGFGILKFIFAMTESPAFGAFIGLVLILAIGYGAWMRFQEPATTSAPPPANPMG